MSAGQRDRGKLPCDCGGDGLADRSDSAPFNCAVLMHK